MHGYKLPIHVTRAVYIIHRYMASVKARTMEGMPCPFCANKLVSVTNSLEAIFPELAREWHPVLNGIVMCCS